MKHKTAIALAAACAALVSQTAAAYVGPGAGLSLLGALWGLLLAIGAALAFVLLWPLRRYLKRRAAGRQNDASAAEAERHRDAPGT